MTFTVATTKQPCVFPTIVTLSGPVLTYGFAWIGLLLLRSRKVALFAFALIFASFSHLRWIQTLTGQGDELILAEQWFGVTSPAIVAAVVFLIGLPPMMAAFRSIANRRRALVFAGAVLLPIPVLVGLLLGDAWLMEKSASGVQFRSVWGIWLIVLIATLIAGALFVTVGPRHLRRQVET